MRSFGIGVSFITRMSLIRSLTAKHIGKQGNFGRSAVRSPSVVIYITPTFVSVFISRRAWLVADSTPPV